MDATGFNRDEIQPDMDLRRDLSIRSSRLPIIMDAAERHFGITIELEDFIHVRTVRDIAQKISEIVARKEGASLPPAAKAAEPGLVQDETLKPLQDEAEFKAARIQERSYGAIGLGSNKIEPGRVSAFSLTGQG